MAKLIACRACKNKISKKAKACPHCGEPVKKEAGCISQILGFILLVVIVYYLGGSCLSTFDEMTEDYNWEEADASSMAYLMCENWVKERLKSPSTAEFPGVFEGKLDNIEKANQRYYIESYVDAQNSFGAMIRINWSCSTTQYEEDKWRLNNINLDE